MATKPAAKARTKTTGTKTTGTKTTGKIAIGAPKPGAGGMALPFTPAIRAGDFVFVSGQVGFDANNEIVAGGITAQVRQTIENMRKILAAADCSLEDVVKVNVWLDDARDFASFNRVYASYFKNVPPARSTVQSPLTIDAKIEMDCVAYKPL